MMSEPYPEVVARFYDAVYAHVRDGVDNRWYLARMESARGPVLEIGVGTGRLLRDALRLGVDAYGIDVSPAMIERCRARLEPHERERVSVDDAVRMRLDRRFALIAAPFRVLSHVFEIEDQLRLLDNVYDHLKPGGAFIFDLYVPNLGLLQGGLPERCDFDGEHVPGRRLRRFVSSAPADLARQTNRVRMTFVWDDDGGERRADWEFEMRFFFRFELEHLVARSKLRLEALHGDFEGGPLTAESRELVVVCRRDGRAPNGSHRGHREGEMDTVIFACVHNAGRSQMAAALFNLISDPSRACALSAGTEPGERVHPEVVEVMREVGVELAGVRPRRLTPEMAQGARHLVTMGCGEQCPFIPGAEIHDWPLPDPKGEPIERVRAIRDDVRARVEAFVAAHGWARR